MIYNADNAGEEYSISLPNSYKIVDFDPSKIEVFRDLY
jgi:hypothetical protein